MVGTAADGARVASSASPASSSPPKLCDWGGAGAGGGVDGAGGLRCQGRPGRRERRRRLRLLLLRLDLRLGRGARPEALVHFARAVHAGTADARERHLQPKVLERIGGAIQHAVAQVGRHRARSFDASAAVSAEFLNTRRG